MLPQEQSHNNQKKAKRKYKNTLPLHRFIKISNHA